MSHRYSHLLSPIKIGNVVLKNRMLHANALPHFLQGPETFPADAVISFYAGVARNGAAVVTCRCGRGVMPRKDLHGDGAHTDMFDINDPAVQNSFSQLADAIHFYDSKASASIRITDPEGYNISDVAPPAASWRPQSTYQTERTPRPRPGKEIPVKLMQEMIEDFVRKAKLYQSLGFDMVNIHASYRNYIFAYSLSPAINKRTDRYGGSLENRARLMLELCQAIKKACGQDFLIEAQVSGEEEGQGGYTLEDMVKYAKLWEGAIDIIQLRSP